MNNTLTVNDNQLMIKEYDNKRVVTMWDIAKVHGVLTQNIRDNFRNNQRYLIEGEDYYLLDKRDEFVHDLIVKDQLKKNAVSRAKDIPLFTETGYLMMVKPMTDELSWKVQRQLVNCYFKIKEVVKDSTEEQQIKSELQSLVDVNKTIELISGIYDSMRISYEDKLKVINSLLQSAGLNVPEIYIPIPIDKSNYISIKEVAERVGVYDRFSRANIEAVAAVMDTIKLDNNEFKATMQLDKENRESYKMTFSPLIVARVCQWLKDNEYPQFLERELQNGDIRRILVVYRDKDFHIHKAN